MSLQTKAKIKKTISSPLLETVLSDDFIKSPLNYIGGKYKILNQILPLFPKKIDNFVDLFAGGCNVGINIEANRIYLNDNLTFLVEMFKKFKANDLSTTRKHIQNRIKQFDLSLTN